VILSANIFAKVLGIRMANRAASVGAFANNVQEFESFREFVTSATITRWWICRFPCCSWL